MLQRGIKFSGESKEFFIRGRLQDLYQLLSEDFFPRRVLDFGCGIGDTCCLLAELFPYSEIVGFDTSDPALVYAREVHGSNRISFFNSFNQIKEIDLCYTNGVFHHILPENRVTTVHQMYQKLAPGGYLSFFENNPWNFGTRIVMKRIPFDQGARLLSARETQKLLQMDFSKLHPPRYLFYFPRSLASLRWMESFLVRFPLGAQYHILARK